MEQSVLACVWGFEMLIHATKAFSTLPGTTKRFIGAAVPNAPMVADSVDVFTLRCTFNEVQREEQLHLDAVCGHQLDRYACLHVRV